VGEKRDYEQKRAYMREYYQRNREKLLAGQAERDAARLEEKRAYNRARHHTLGEARVRYCRERYARDKGEKQAKQRAYYRANKEAHIVRVYERKKRVVMGYKLSTAAQQVEIDGMYLFTACFPWFEVDHIVPLRAKHHSGLHVLNNMQVLTKVENRAKRNRVCPAYIQLLEQRV
jgi:nitrous oxide reductase